MVIHRLTRKRTKDIPVVCEVDLEKYQGLWYEIARFPHTFEKDLDDVTANYRIIEEGKLEVINTGYRHGMKKEIKGKVTIPDRRCMGHLRVSFFWPFKSDYKVIYLDQVDYQYVIVAGGSMDYLWFLGRKPVIEEALYQELLEFVRNKGYAVDRIIRVRHNAVK